MECNQEEECDFFQSEQEKNDCFDFNLGKGVEYYDEIYSMMHAFGDVKKPLSSSVKLICNLLESQLALLMEKAENITKLREGNKISHEDLLFLLRRNKIMLKRLLYFLSVEDTRSYLLPGMKKLGGGMYPEKGERVSQCLKYLAVIEKFKGDLTSFFKDKTLIDNVYLKRLKRRDLMTSSMTKDEYENFFEYTLRVSFCYKHSNMDFKKWLQQCSCIKLDITPLALSIIHFLARETIAGIVEKALEIKSRKYKSDIFPSRNFSNSVDLFQELKYGSDLDESEVILDLHKSEKHFSSEKVKVEIDKSENYLQPSFSKTSEYNCKRNENSDIEVNSVTHDSSVSMQEMNLLSGTSLDADNIVNCSVETNAIEKGMIFENCITDNSSPDNQKKNAVSISSRLNKNVSSKSYGTKKSNVSKSRDKIANPDAKISLHHCAGKRKKNCDICDNSKLDNKSSDTYFVIGEGTNSDLNCEAEIDQAFSGFQHNVPGASKKVAKNPYFSLNFQEKTLSIYCDGSETFEIDTDTKRKQTRKANKNNVIKVMGSKDPTKSCFVESIEESKFDGSEREHHNSKCLPSYSVKDTGHLPFVPPIFKDSKIHWFPQEAITPAEIQAAFVYYQHPLPMSYLMKTGLPPLPKKPNLVCLANPDEFNIYL